MKALKNGIRDVSAFRHESAASGASAEAAVERTTKRLRVADQESGDADEAPAFGPERESTNEDESAVNSQQVVVVDLSTEPAELTPADEVPSVTAVATSAAATHTAPVTAQVTVTAPVLATGAATSSSTTTPPQVNFAWTLLQGTRGGVRAVAR